MIKENMLEAEKEAKRFLEKVKELKVTKEFKEAVYSIYGCKESGAVRRASMDLTRALSKMRKPL